MGIVLKADKNICEINGWQSNTGEVNVRTLTVEMCEEMCSCAMAFVTFKLKDGTVYESLVKDGKANIPEFTEDQFIEIGVYSADIENDKCKKRYSPHPTNVYVPKGSYTGNGTEPPIPTPGTFEELLGKIANLENGTIKTITEPCHIADLEKGAYIVQNTVGEVTIANVKDDGSTIDDGYVVVRSGLLVVVENIKSKEEDGTETSIISFSAQGIIAMPNTSNETGMAAQHTIENARNISGHLLQSYKMPESGEGYEANKWYSAMPLFIESDISASAIKKGINESSTHFDVPSARAVVDYVNTVMGGIDNGFY